MSEIIIRKAERADCNEIYKLICAIAEYEHMSELVTGSVSDIEHLLFGSGVGRCLLACDRDKDGERVVGFALYFYNLSTFKCRAGIYLEDLFVYPEYRGRGIGKRLLKTLCGIAKDEGLGRMDWECLDWNQPSLDFYHSLGARDMDEWIHLRVDEADFDKLLNS